MCKEESDKQTEGAVGVRENSEEYQGVKEVTPEEAKIPNEYAGVARDPELTDPANGQDKQGDKESGNSTVYEEVLGKLTDLGNRFDGLRTDFQSKLKYDQYKEKIIDNMHQELQAYKDDLIQHQIRPIIVDIIHVIDDVGKLVPKHLEKDPSELDPLKLLNQMDGIAEDLEEVLYRQGVEAFSARDAAYDVRLQKILKTEITSEQSKDKTVSRQVHKGYKWEGKVLRQEMVNVYVYKAPAESV